jgi:hypothetical protein
LYYDFFLQSGDETHIYTVDFQQWWWSSCRWGETTSLNCCYQTVYCISPRWFMSCQNHGGTKSTEGNSWFVHQSSLAILPAESSGSKQEEWANRIWPCKVFLFILAGNVLYAIKSYNMEPLALLPHWRKACCGFLLPSKIHRLVWVWTHDPWVQW